MKFHMLSNCGEGAGLLSRIQDEGNECTIDISDKDYMSTFDGILTKSIEVPRDAIILVDTSGLGDKADALKKKGYKVFGGSVFADKLEQDRDFGLQYMQDHRIEVPNTKVFRTFVEAIDWVKGQKGDDTYVFKPNGEHLPCRLTYCATDNEDLISYLRFVQRHFTHEIDDFILQAFVEGSIVSTEFFCGPKGLVRPANHTVEVKKFLNDDLGPSTGCQGNLVWVADDDEVTELLENLEEDLIKEGYVGPIDLNAILSDEGVKGLEWTPRFGLDAMPTLLQLVDGDVGKLIADITLGQTRVMELYDAIAGGIRITIPPYPLEPMNLKTILKDSPNVGVPIRDLPEDAYYYEVMMQDGELVHSPGPGTIAVVTNCGEDAEDILDEIEEALEDVRIPDKQYRTDLCEKLPDMMEEACEALESMYART